MASKILSVALFILLVVMCVLFYKEWSEKSDATKTTTAVRDTLAQTGKQLVTANTAVTAVHRAEERTQDQRASWAPLAQLQVQAMSEQQQRLSVIESLIRNQRLAEKDTTDRRPAVTFNSAESAAITVAMRLSDSLIKADKSQRDALALCGLKDDSLKVRKLFDEKSLRIATQKGWFTRKRKALLQHVLSSPYR